MVVGLCFVIQRENGTRRVDWQGHTWVGKADQ